MKKRPAEKDLNKDLRRYQNNLIVSGYAVMLFTLWTVLKAVLTAFLIDDSTGLNAEEEEALFMLLEETGMLQILITIFIIAAVIGLLVILMRIYIWRCANAEGKGKKKGYFYVVLAMVLAVINALSIIGVWFGFSDEGLLSVIVSVLFDAASLFSLLELIFSSIKVKKLRKVLQAEG